MSNDRPTILIVDDEENIRESFTLILQDEYEVISVSTGEAALKKIVDQKIDLVFLDIRMPGMDGIETLKHLKKIDPQVEVIMVTAVNDVQKASESVKFGANNYIVKPFDIAQILSIAKALTRKKEILKAVQRVKIKENQYNNFPEISGQSKALRNLLDKIEELSNSNSPVLILGETGTEKTTIANLIHLKSQRKDNAFKIFNIPKKINEKEIYADLFGVGTGSSIYDLEKSVGLIEKCDKGTILINNIQNAPQRIINAIVSAIEKKSFVRAGTSQSIPLDTRFIFSANEDYMGPENLMCDSILVPPLRARREDILDIFYKLLENISQTCGIKVKEISLDAQEILNTYPWPGNYEEFKTTILYSCFNTDNEILKSKNLPLSILIWSPAISYVEEAMDFSLEQLLSKFEKDYIFSILKLANFEIQTAAKALDINKNTLLSKIESLEIR